MVNASALVALSSLTVWFAMSLIVGALFTAFTVSVAELLVTSGGMPLLATQRNLSPLITVVVPLTVSTLVVTPLKVTPFTTLTKPVVPFACRCH